MNWLKSIVGWLGCGANPFDQMLRQWSFSARMAGKEGGNVRKTEFLAEKD